MLQLQTKSINSISRISKLLVKYNIKANITDSVITLDGDISEELLTKLCNDIDISVIQNFASTKHFVIHEEIPSAKSENVIPYKDVEKTQETENPQTPSTLVHGLPEYDLIYSEVKRGQVYWCDFGESYGSEQGGCRPAIIVQNDNGNLHSATTIVIPCTTAHKKRNLLVYYQFTFSSQNMIDFDLARVSSEKNIILADHIRVVDKTRLRKYLGTLTPEFMKIIEGKIDISLHLSRDVKTIEKKVYVDRLVSQKAIVNPEVPKERQDLNMVQVKLLSFVDINELLKVSQNQSTDEVKAQKILELFGFNLQQNGVEYLLKAISDSPKDAYFNLETLAEKVSAKESVDKEEIKRLIVARVKEIFGFKKAPTIDFIRLINNFLLKQEEL